MWVTFFAAIGIMVIILVSFGLLAFVFETTTDNTQPARYWYRVRDWTKERHNQITLLTWAVAVTLVLWAWISDPQYFPGSFRNEVASIAITVLVLDTLNRYRTREERKQELIEQMGSQVRDAAIEATRLLREHGWLTNGSLRARNFEFANLEEADLAEADLERASLAGANLRGAILMNANLRSTELLGADVGQAKFLRADISGANLRSVRNLRDASLTDIIYDDKTIWPEGHVIPVASTPGYIND